MKVLYIHESCLHGIGGSSLGVKKQYSCIKSICIEKGYTFKSLTLDENTLSNTDIKKYKTKKNDILARLYGHSNYFYFVWKKLKNEMRMFDIVILGRSRLGFIAKDVKKKKYNCKVFSFFENIEFDYAKVYFSENIGIIRYILTIIERFVVKRDENACVKYSDELIMLSERDKNKVGYLYGDHEKTCHIIPVCLEKTIDLKKVSRNGTIAFIGSLYSSANIKSLNWFIDNVWKCFYQKTEIEFIIAGNNPPNHLRKAIKQFQNIILIENFGEVIDIIPKNALMVAPIIEGAGMKVKVAETLSMGLPIVGSDEALVGYEEVLNKQGIYRANTTLQYKDVIDEYIKSFAHIKEEDIIQKQELFKEFYSYERAKKCLEMLLHEAV